MSKSFTQEESALHTHRVTLVPGNGRRYSDILHVRPRTLPHANSKGQPLANPFGPVELSIWVIRKLAVSGFSSCRHECPASEQRSCLMHFYDAKIDQRFEPAIPILLPRRSPSSFPSSLCNTANLSLLSLTQAQSMFGRFGVCCCHPPPHTLHTSSQQ